MCEGLILLPAFECRAVSIYPAAVAAMEKGTAAYAQEEAGRIYRAKEAELGVAQEFPCSDCKDGKQPGIGKLKGGVLIEGRPMICVSCNGTGRRNRATTLRRLKYSSVWCTCEKEDDEPWNATEAEDGEDVFGNVTYVCLDCGLVIQFG